MQDGLILIGVSKSGRDLTAECIELALANRHGLVTGATGTGKTVTLQVLAEGFSAAGVPGVRGRHQRRSFWASQPKGTPAPKLVARAEEIGLKRYGNTELSDGVLGYFRRRRPSGPRDGAGDGTAAARRA